MKKLYSFSIALIVLLLMAAGASAVPGEGPVHRYTSDGGDAYAYLEGDNDAQADVDVEVCGEETTLDLFASWYDDEGIYHSYSTNGEILIDSKDFKNAEVNSAKLDVIELPVTDNEGNEATIDVEVNWNGIKDSECSYKFICTCKDGKFEFDGKMAYATVTASINGVEFTENEDSYGDLDFGKFVGVYKEK